MSLHIIHLTDIHISSSNDIILGKAESMAKACCANIDKPADVIIAVTGDIAYSGDESQYILFERFIDTLVSALNNTTGITSVKVFTVPGNHDCNFSKATKVREKLIETIDCRSTSGYEEECVSFIAKAVQADYYTLDSEKCIGLNNDNYLFRVTQLDTSIGNAMVLQYNTAWVSTKNEQAGNLCMPIDLLPEMPVQESDLVIAMMHHPFCWLHPDNKSAFEIHMRNTADIILCGHEHFQDSVRQDGKDWSFYVLEGKELQSNPQIEVSCFSIYSFDQTLTVLKTKNYRWDGNGYALEDEDDRPFSRNQSISQPIMSPNNETIEELRDAGAIFHHPQIDVLSLNDIYVWPSLEEHSVDNPDVSIITEGDKVYEQLMQNPISIIYGEETCGKTSLAKQIYLECLRHGKCCIKGTGKSFTSKKEGGL